MVESHRCKHCQIPLQVGLTKLQPPFRIPFPHSIREAGAAARDGCHIFEQLISSYSCRSRWKLINSHVFHKCNCCGGALERLQYVIRSLSSRPFQLLFGRHLYASRPEPTLDSIVHLDCGNGPSGRHYNAYTYTGDYASTLIPSFDPEVNAPSSIDAVRDWLQKCRCEAKLPTQKSFTPTRLLDIGGTQSPENVLLVETAGTVIPGYACLSYCWGGSQPVMNTVQRKSSANGWVIILDRLPRSFKDAIQTLQRLGFRYVWIDSLCIIQDDLEDKEREICQMPHIYKYSDLTLCASSAVSCETGFLHARQDYSEFQLPLRMPGGKPGTLYLDRFLWSFPPVEEPLGGRSWALQEHFLSPRLLEYGWRTLRWSCSCSERYSGYEPLPAIANSHGDTGPSPRYSLFGYLNPLGKRGTAESKDELFECWIRIVDQYTRRKLTLPNDRLAAIGGMAAYLQEKTGVPYLAGLWDYEKLPYLLLWKVKLPVHDLNPRPMTSRAPSWSWAAVDGPVSIHASQTQVDFFRVLATEVSGGFGLSASGTITVEGPVREGAFWCEGWAKSHRVAPSDDGLSNGNHELTLWPDCSEELCQHLDETISVSTVSLAFLAVGKADWDEEVVRGLILSKSEGESYYKRLGLFQLRSRGMLSINNWTLKALSIA